MTKLLEDEKRRCDLKYLLDRLDDQIHIEIELIGHRMNVLVVAQAFLFAAYTTDLLTKNQKQFADLEIALLHVIPIVGAIICIMVGVSLIVAIVVLRSRKKERDQVRNKLREEMRETTLKDIVFGENIEILGHVSSDTTAHKIGNLPPAFLSFLILGAWIYLLHSYSSVR